MLNLPAKAKAKGTYLFVLLDQFEVFGQSVDNDVIGYRCVGEIHRLVNRLRKGVNVHANEAGRYEHLISCREQLVFAPLVDAFLCQLQLELVHLFGVQERVERWQETHQHGIHQRDVVVLSCSIAERDLVKINREAFSLEVVPHVELTDPAG